MKRIITHLLISLVLACSITWALPAAAQSRAGHHGSGGHHGSANHRGSAGHLDIGGHHVNTGVHHHGHVSLHHLHSTGWSPRPRGTCGRLGWRAHDHHWRSAFDYYGLFDREAGVECLQNDAGKHR